MSYDFSALAYCVHGSMVYALYPAHGYAPAQDDVRRGALVMAASAMLYGIVQVPASAGATYDPEVS
jgi:hypothetical protein